MSEYRLITKKQPTTGSRFPIQLLEYMIFENTSAKQRELILKLHNQSAFEMDDILIEIRQLDASGEIIYAASYAFEDIAITSQKNYFIPDKKIRLYDECESIVYRLLKAESSSMTWEINNAWNKKTQPKAEEAPETEPLITKSYTPVPITLPVLFPVIIVMLHVIILISVFYAANIQ